MGHCVFDGSIIEVFAQLAFENCCSFELLLDHGNGLFDCSKVLVLYIGAHNCKFDCRRGCPLVRLLKLEADPNSRGSRITPLQIAVATRDVAGVKTLLKAGADVNDTGCAGGTVWEERTMMSSFDHLHGASALYILRDYDCMWSPERLEGRRENRNLIEESLLQYGAQEFLRPWSYWK